MTERSDEVEMVEMLVRAHRELRDEVSAVIERRFGKDGASFVLTFLDHLSGDTARLSKATTARCSTTTTVWLC